MTTIFHGISPIVIYESSLQQTDQIKDLFHKKFSKYGFEIKLGDRPDGMTSSNGEYLGKAYVHRDKDFKIFFDQLKFHITEYLTKLGFAADKLSYHVLKSWYVVITELNSMNFHHHDSADLSFVYYVDVPEDCANIRFLNQNFNNKNAIFNGIFISGDLTKHFINDFNNPHTAHSIPFQPKEGHLLIFPSALEHGIEQTDNSVNRYSIAGDIKFTLKKEIIDYETGLVHPSLWTEL